MTIQEYLRNKDIRLNTTAMLKDGKWYRYIGGAWVPEKQFQLMFPLAAKVGNNSNNPNRRVSYLD